jgi:hypothetical protein
MTDLPTLTELEYMQHASETLNELIYGNLEKSLSLPIADSVGVNVNESERERTGIFRRQFCGVRRVGPIFRGALTSGFTHSMLYGESTSCGLASWNVGPLLPNWIARLIVAFRFGVGVCLGALGRR